MHTMGEKRDMFVGLRWKNEIKRLGKPHALLNPFPEHDIGAGKQNSNDFDLTPFLQSTQAWRWRIQEEQKSYAKNDKRRANVLEKDATRCMNSETDDAGELNEENLKYIEQGIKVVDKSLMCLLFCNRIK